MEMVRLCIKIPAGVKLVDGANPKDYVLEMIEISIGRRMLGVCGTNSL